MNKPAAKEPSMDEILSSIRQIIADDDADISGAQKEVEGTSPSAPVSDDIAALVMADDADASEDEDGDADGPLELMADQIVEEGEEDAPEASASDDTDDSDDFVVPEIVVPEDISFEPSNSPSPAPAVEEVEPEPSAKVEPSAVESHMPDPTLSDEMVEKLLEPTTEAATRHAFSKIGSLGLGTPGMTVENVVRELLKPMLKEWLDENLPSVVETMVEREIERLSRGGR